MLHIETMHDACTASLYDPFLSHFCRVSSEPRASGTTTTSTDTSCTVVRARFVLLKGGRDWACWLSCRYMVLSAVGVVCPLAI